MLCRSLAKTMANTLTTPSLALGPSATTSKCAIFRSTTWQALLELRGWRPLWWRLDNNKKCRNMHHRHDQSKPRLTCCISSCRAEKKPPSNITKKMTPSEPPLFGASAPMSTQLPTLRAGNSAPHIKRQLYFFLLSARRCMHHRAINTLMPTKMS